MKTINYSNLITQRQVPSYEHPIITQQNFPMEDIWFMRWPTNFDVNELSDCSLVAIFRLKTLKNKENVTN